MQKHLRLQKRIAFLASVLEGKNDLNGASEMRQKSFDLETDPIKKAKIKLKFAQAAKGRGQLSKARSLAREAIKFNSNYGKAYLFIAKLYQTSVNKCGKNEFEKRMVYVAALNKARKAASVDPSISGIAKKYIKITLQMHLVKKLFLPLVLLLVVASDKMLDWRNS